MADPTRNELLEVLRDHLSRVLPPEVAEGLRALTVQAYTEANVKLGKQYEFTIYQAALAAAGVVDVVLVTGTKPIILKGRTVIFDGSGVQTIIYEGPTYTGGSSLPYYNMNRITPTVGGVTILGGATVTAPGTQVFATKTFLGSKEPGSHVASSERKEAEGLEYIFAPSTAYLFRFTSLDTVAQAVSSYATWYEGDLDLPLV